MTNLSKALELYYRREKNKIIFINNQTLNQLAFTMWEKLGYQQIDGSVISRVISGERLFNALQLNAFCIALNLKKSEEEFLFSCLVEDTNAKNNLASHGFFIPASVGYDLIENLVKDGFRTLSEGKTKNLETKCNLLDTVIHLTNNKIAFQNDKMSESIALNLYLKGRVVEGLGLPEDIIRNTLPISKKLFEIARTTKNKAIYAYGLILLSNAYYLTGGYSSSTDKHKFYQSSISLGRKAMENLDDTNNEKLFGLRVMSASASYIKDESTTMQIYATTNQILTKQPLENRVNALHLCGTLSKGLAVCNKKNPFFLKEKAIEYFNSDLTNTGIYEISSIKVEIDTLIALKSGENKYMTNRIKRGMEIAEQDGFIRHKNYFNTLLANL